MVPSLCRLVVALAVAASTACASPVESDAGAHEVRFTVDRGRYAPGDTVAARVENTSEWDVAYNFCIVTLEREDPSGWIVADEPLKLCTAELRRMSPGESVEIRRDLPARLEAGRYRLRVTVYVPLVGESGIRVHSQSFEIAR